MARSWLVQPLLEHRTQNFGERRDTLLPSLSETSNMRASGHGHGAAIEADQFGESHARLYRRQEETIVAATDPQSPVWCCHERLDLIPDQELHLALRADLAGDGEHALDLVAKGRLLECKEPKNARIAVSLRLYVVVPARLSAVRSSRNAMTSSASKSSSIRDDGGFPVFR